jgi:hypothetical protein
MRIIHPEWRITSLPIPITLSQQHQQQRSRRLNNDSGDFKVSRNNSSSDRSSSSSRNDDGDNVHKDRRRLFGLAKDYHLIRSKGGIYNDNDEVVDDDNDDEVVDDDGSINSLSHSSPTIYISRYFQWSISTCLFTSSDSMPSFRW